MKIVENVYLVPNIVANPFIVTDPDGLTIIDVGVPFSERKILAYIANLGNTHHDLKRIILTHSDTDHVGSLAALQKATGARTYASRIEADAIAVGKPSRKPNPPGYSFRRSLFGLLGRFVKLVKPVQVDEILTDGQTLPVLGGLQVVETPGIRRVISHCSHPPQEYCSVEIQCPLMAIQFRDQCILVSLGIRQRQKNQ